MMPLKLRSGASSRYVNGSLSLPRRGAGGAGAEPPRKFFGRFYLQKWPDRTLRERTLLHTHAHTAAAAHRGEGLVLGIVLRHTAHLPVLQVGLHAPHVTEMCFRPWALSIMMLLAIEV